LAENWNPDEDPANRLSRSSPETGFLAENLCQGTRYRVERPNF